MAAMLSCCALEACECASCMACSCVSSLVSATLSQAARLGHVLIIFSTFTFAIVLGEYYPDSVNGYASGLAKIDLTSGCNNSFDDSCIYRQLVYRASFALFLVFLLLAVGSVSDYVNRGLWPMKFGVAFILFISFWWGDNSFFSGWAEFARVVSFFWLLVQALLLMDFAHDIHGACSNIIHDNNSYLGLIYPRVLPSPAPPPSHSFSLSQRSSWLQLMQKMQRMEILAPCTSPTSFSPLVV